MDSEKRPGLNSTLKPGAVLLCEVEEREPGGYSAKILPNNVDAFLPSREELKPGQKVPATFVCMSQSRALMTFAFMIGTTERVQFGLPTAEEESFAVWADSYPKIFRVRRAIDLIMPSLTGKLNQKLRCGDFDVEHLLEDLENSHLTGCLKAENDEVLSRSAALLYKGRVVGAIYGRKPQPNNQGTVEEATRLMREDLMLPETMLQVYELPEEVVLCMSALFLGVPVDEAEAERVDAAEYMKELLPSLEKRDGTACITVQSGEEPPECLGFVHQGKQAGSFSIAAQRFAPDFKLIEEVMGELPESRAGAYLLPREITSDAVRFGYSFSNYSKPEQ